MSFAAFGTDGDDLIQSLESAIDLGNGHQDTAAIATTLLFNQLVLATYILGDDIAIFRPRKQITTTIWIDGGVVFGFTSTFSKKELIDSVV